MSKLVVEGGRRLKGCIKIHGAKNSVLPILAATLLNAGKNVIYECPRLKDVYASLDILRHLGCDVQWEGETLIVDSSGMNEYHIPERLMCEMRSSVMFLGAILSRQNRAAITHPGGCDIGQRPIDLHIKALKEMGITVDEMHGQITCETKRVNGADIVLSFPSVGATENIMLAAAMACGRTTISNAAKEPEIVDLQDYLNAMGANVRGAGTGVITIIGVNSLSDVKYRVIPDRIEAASYLAAASITGGEIELKEVNPEHLNAVLALMRDCGCHVESGCDTIYLKAPERLTSIEYIRTMPHPGFPTDAQAPVMAMLAVADGVSVFAENIFDNRYKHIIELNRMGANIFIDGRVAIVRGVERFSAAKVMSTDLRGSAGLVIAGLQAEGITEIGGLEHLDRGYVAFEEGLASLGANIKRVD